MQSQGCYSHQSRGTSDLVIAAFAGPSPEGAAPAWDHVRTEHPAVWNAAYERELPRARAEAIAQLVVAERRAARSLWADGWTEAITAMRQAAQNAALSPDVIEWRIPDQLTQRGPDTN